ncbi:hypothetical protein, partial [Rhodococcus wratislaviensis]|uniref:hypothetical protein n=1 Tax=Rhodococcus wratislaviensis TaxID=44752 RepID=UPI0036654A8B
MAENNGENSRETQDAERQLIVLRAKERNRPFILARPNVIGLDVGYRVRGGKPTDELVVIAYVSQKVDRSLLREVDLVPASVRVDEEEVPVDVVESSVPRALTYTVRSRPLRGGNSIFPGVISDLAGTCGICVTIGGATLILSNNHVLADSNSLPIGSPIVQPGT